MNIFFLFLLLFFFLSLCLLVLLNSELQQKILSQRDEVRLIIRKCNTLLKRAFATQVINPSNLCPQLNSIKKLIVISFLLVASNFSSAQKGNETDMEIYLNQSYSNLALNRFISKVEQNFPFHFYIQAANFPDIQISYDEDSLVLKNILVNHLLPFNIFVSYDKKGNIFLRQNAVFSTHLPTHFFKGPIVEVEKEEKIEIVNDYEQTSEESITQSVIIGTKEKGVNRYTSTLSGKVINSKTGQLVEGATIVVLRTGKGVVTDKFGSYNISLSIGKHLLKISSVNIQEKKIEIDLQSDGNLDILIEDKVVVLQDVIVRADMDNKVVGTQMGLDKVITKNVKKIPLVFGEKDIVKVAMLLPGVQTVGEGSTGFNVRGSPTDQNLFYINHVPIYNTSHLSGFFSAFNADIIDEFSLYRSNIPLEYGGRISSVFEIKTKTGSKTKTTARGGIGPITSRLTVEGPLKKEKSSFLVGVRSTYSNWILHFIDDPIVKNSKAQFADVVSNFSLMLDDNDHLNIFTYFSTDRMDLYTKSKYNYQNYGGSVAWQHFFQNKNEFEMSFAQSGYRFEEENNQFIIASYSHNNQLAHTELKSIFKFSLSENHNSKLGFNSTLYQINKGNYNPLTNTSYVQSINFGKEKGIENGLFISNEWKANSKLTLSGGLRYNLYTYLGAQDVNQYADGMPFTYDNLIEVLHFGNWKPIKTYGGLDYRLASNFLINDNFSIKAAYDRLHQFIYMLSSTISVSPNYKWKLSDYNTKPMVGNQLTLGIYGNLWKNKYQLSIESYYKKSKNVVELRDGADLFFSGNSEQSTLQGELDAYGIELMLKKMDGDLSGWVNYTYSNSSVIVDSPFPENRINYGEMYPSNYDKPHAFNVVANYDLNKRISLSANVVYATGRPITYPKAIYYFEDIPTLSYSSRNAYRLPDYFRVDFSYNLEGNLLKNKIGHGTWAFAIYNVFGRRNAYSVYFEEKDGLIQAYRLSVFGAPIFSVTYNFKLGNYASE